jgi:hypothetical protein
LRKPLGLRQEIAKHALKIRQNVVVPVADNGDTPLSEPLRPAIVGFLRLFGVLSAVHFDGQAKWRTIKIDYKRSNRVLFSERRAIELSAAQRTP